MKRIVLLLLTVSNFSFSQDLNDQISAIEEKLISWRHDIHKHPELSNREYRTSKVIAKHLKGLNIEVTENVAKTGVVGILNGDSPGKVVALRADIDKLALDLKRYGLISTSRTGAVAMTKGAQIFS